jgi:cobaltochelatase CobT
MFREDLLKENLDGEALEWAARRLLARPERRRILILLGDGVPHDRAIAATNGENYLRDHLQAVVQRLERHAGLELLAIGFGAVIRQNYPRAVRVCSPHDLAKVLTRELAQLLASESLRGRADTVALPREDH